MAKQWNIAETISGATLNTHLSDKLELIRKGNISVRTSVMVHNSENGRIANTAVPFDVPFRLVHTMPIVGVARLILNLPSVARRHAGATANNAHRFDVKINDSFFVSSGTGTSLTDGLILGYQNSLHDQVNLFGKWLIPDLVKGINTFELYGACVSGDFSAEILAGAEMVIEQYGVSLRNILLYGEPL